ncbi:hypothetical protein [Desulfonatronovibrio hydrogenovorans]|uniref:hypothetical protein n=1 Tax=Desulfonatronovibrio hydrogenovorans TaxID=53245 RepID=UPI0012378FEA|nr:hypothetical protein [Desulfonatronovibrio hydrogenovorans]
MKNLIILTTGSSGSSVLAGTIGSKGLWLGDETKKLGFDTYENAELVDLDIEILRLSGFNRYDCNDIPGPGIERIERLAKNPDGLDRFVRFVQKSQEHSPWLWKDPRLSFTIHFWAHFLDLKNINFIFIEREPDQSYTGLILKRKIPMSYSQHNLMNDNYKKSCSVFFCRYGLSYLHLTFEDFLVEPDEYLQRISSHLDLDISLSDLRKIYKGKLHQKRWSGTDFFKARILYNFYRYARRDYIKFPRIDH